MYCKASQAYKSHKQLQGVTEGLNPTLKSMRKTARFYLFLFRNKKSCSGIQP